MTSTASEIEKLKCLKVIDCLALTARPGVLVSARLLADFDLENGAVLESAQTQGRWCIIGNGFVPAQTWAEGIRSIALDPLNESRLLHADEILYLIED